MKTLDYDELIASLVVNFGMAIEDVMKLTFPQIGMIRSFLRK